MKKDKLIEKLNFLASQVEKSNPEISAVLYTASASIYTNQEKILFDSVRKVGNNTIIPEVKLLEEAQSNIDNLLKELNMN